MSAEEFLNGVIDTVSPVDRNIEWAEEIAAILQIDFPGVPIGAIEILDALASVALQLQPGRAAGVAYQRLTIGASS